MMMLNDKWHKTLELFDYVYNATTVFENDGVSIGFNNFINGSKKKMTKIFPPKKGKIKFETFQFGIRKGIARI